MTGKKFVVHTEDLTKPTDYMHSTNQESLGYKNYSIAGETFTCEL